MTTITKNGLKFGHCCVKKRTACGLIVLTFLLAASFLPALSHADDVPVATVTDKGAEIEIGNATTHLVVDTEANNVRIMINGKEVGRFMEDGLHVNGSIHYTGNTVDTYYLGIKPDKKE